MTEDTKWCGYCEAYHPLTTEYWNGREGKRRRCKVENTERLRKMREENPDKFKAYSSKFYKNHSKEVIQQNYEYAKKRRKEDMNYNLTILLRQRLCKAVKGGYKSGSAVADLGCSIEEFHSYLESKFKEGMSWDNHGEWEIDHIRPLCSFNLVNREELLQACHYTNMQPLWKLENIRKSGKLVVDSDT